MHQNLWFLLGITELSSVVVGLVFFAHLEEPIGYILLEPTIDEISTVSSDNLLSFSGQAHQLNGCFLRHKEDSILIENNQFQGNIQPPTDPGRHLLWFDVICEQNPISRHRTARWVDIGESNINRPEVLRIHLASTELTDRLNGEIPSLINEQIETLLPIMRNTLESQTEELNLPNWLLTNATLGSETFVRANHSNVHFSDNGIILDLDLDLNLELIFSREPGRLERIFHRNASSSEQLSFAIHDHFEPISAQIAITTWPEVEITELLIESTACEDQITPFILQACHAIHLPGCDSVVQPFIEDICEQVVDHLYANVGQWLRSKINEYISSTLASFDLEAFFHSVAMAWATSVSIDNRVERLLQNTEIELVRITQDETGIAFSISVAPTWLEQSSPQELHIEQTSSGLDLAISSAFVNKVLATAFDRPLLDTLYSFEALAIATNANAELQESIRRIEYVISGRNEAGPLLEAVQLAVSPTFSLTPVLRIDQNDDLLVAIHDVRVLQSTAINENAVISFSTQSPLTIEQSQHGYALTPLRSHVLTHISGETISVNQETRIRLNSLVEFLQEELRRINSGHENPRIDEAIVDELLRSLPMIPPSISNEFFTVQLTEILGNQADQSILFRGEIVQTNGHK